MSEVTHLLDAIQAGDRKAAADLLPLVYDELRKLAVTRMSAEVPGHTLNPTALVHEAYLRLVGEQEFVGKSHFFAAAAEAMRRVLVDAARRKATAKRGGGASQVKLDLAYLSVESADDLVALDDALKLLAAEEPRKAELVRLRFFAGLATPEAAAVLGISVATAERWWAFSKAWLYSELSGEENSRFR